MQQPAQKQEFKVNKTFLIIGLIGVMALVALLGSGFGRDPHRIDTDALIGQQAPRFQLVDLDGNQVNLSDSLGKRWVVINFWSTWCGPCKQEHPYLLKAPELWPDVLWLGIIYQDEPEKIRRYLAQKGTAYPHLIDPQSAMSVDFGVTGVPETYFINPEGVVVQKFAEPIGHGHIASVLGPPRTQ